MIMDECNSDVFHDSSSGSCSNLANLNSSSNSNTVGGGGNEEVATTTPRVKFLCSFGGSILPRPQDGKLRYVGGETRILSVPREIGYEELMGRMRELYDGAAILKYQQPEEDLDALVSVVNDDDVTNMMEEYDKLGLGDGFTRLRIFLFSQVEQDVPAQYMDDERDTERRYVDALNSLNETLDYRRDRMIDSPVMTPVDEVQIAEQLYNSMNLEGSVHNQRNYEMALPQYNLRQLAVPSLGSGQYSGSVTQRYTEDAPWSPAYYSPRCGGGHEGRAVAEYPPSPSSARFRVPPQEAPDRFSEEPNHLHMSNHVPYDQQQQYSDNVVWMSPGGLPGNILNGPSAVDRGGFPGNILNGPSAVDGANVCGHCKLTFQRNPSSSDFHWKPEEHSHLEQLGNGFSQVPNPCVECLPAREAAMLNSDARLQHGVYNREQVDPHSLYNEAQALDRNWILQNQSRMDESRQQISGVGRMSEHYVFSGAGTNTPIGPGNLPDVNHIPANYVRNEDLRYIRPGAELGGEMYHGQAVIAGSHVHNPLDERGTRASHSAFSYGADIPQQVLHNNPSAQAMWRNAATPVHVPPTYDSFNIQPRNNVPGPVIPRNTVEGSPGFFVGADQSPWVDSPHRRMGADGYPYGHIPKLTPSGPQELQQTFVQDPFNNLPSTSNLHPVQVTQRSSELPSSLLSDNLPPSGGRGYTPVLRDNSGNIEVGIDERSVHREVGDTTHLNDAEESPLCRVHPTQQENYVDMNPATAPLDSEHPGDQSEGSIQPVNTITSPVAEDGDLSFLPELIASAKRAKLKSVEVVKARAQEDSNDGIIQEKQTKLAVTNETEAEVLECNSDDGFENENLDSSTIEQTKAEEEAIAKGLQTIRNDDLEEIRELGTGTYGAVYHGKWKGSDVAVKRIKASCFAGRPSERERLIADFWKEALILSSLHHPNVVSFYGIVRDGPDGSLATVTEFMINGSLKQYLQKKDRTIDRRKRLIIAMDAAFGMEYLHGKNIVHFDLKCENLLVNMRDPHRPVCKIGDLGLSKVKQQTLVSGGVRGTLPWMAPELLSGKSNMVTEKIDVYSFGIVMWELLTGEEPYKDRHCASIIGGIVHNTLRPQIPTWCDPEWKSLMESCWAAEPADRPSFPEISQKLRSMAAAMNIK